MNYVQIFFANLFAWVGLISVIVIVIGAMCNLGHKIQTLGRKMNADSNADATTPSVAETLSAIEYAKARNIKQRRN